MGTQNITFFPAILCSVYRIVTCFAVLKALVTIILVTAGMLDVVLYVHCFGVCFCTVSPSVCLDDIKGSDS